MAIFRTIGRPLIAMNGDFLYKRDMLYWNNRKFDSHSKKPMYSKAISIQDDKSQQYHDISGIEPSESLVDAHVLARRKTSAASLLRGKMKP